MREKGRPFIRGGGGRPSIGRDRLSRKVGYSSERRTFVKRGGVRRGRRTFVRREGPFIEVEECSSKEGASVEIGRAHV